MKISEIHFPYQTDLVSQTAFDAHMTLYKGYVNAMNGISKELEENGSRREANASYSKYRGLKKGETFALNGVLLHELYFQNIASKTKGPGAKTFKMIEENFGGFESWKNDFIACGVSARGWVMLAYEQRSKSFRNFIQDVHDEGVITGAFPILVMDMYEHAYYFDYQTDKEAYIRKFLSSVHWKVVEDRLNVLG